MENFARKAARPMELLLGIIFIVAAVLKAMDANLFVAQIHSYQIVTDPLLKGLVALGTIFAETFLGIAMLIGLRLRMAVLALVQAMLLFFTLVIVYAVAVHGLTDCGCFGKVKMTPPVAIGKNVVMMLMAAIAWYGLRLQGKVEDIALMMPRALVGAGMAVVLTAYAVPQVYQADSFVEQAPSPIVEAPVDSATADIAEAVPPNGSGPYSGIVVENETGQQFDLGQGVHLVASLSMTCDHCMEEVPALNALHFDPAMPPVVALAHEPDAGSLDLFKLQSEPLFPMHPMGNNFLRFSRYIGSAPPRVALVVNGTPIEIWDGTTPSSDVVQGILDAAGLAVDQ